MAKLKYLTPLLAMILIATILIIAICNNIDSGILYTGITLLSGLGGYVIGRNTAPH